MTYTGTSAGAAHNEQFPADELQKEEFRLHISGVSGFIGNQPTGERNLYKNLSRLQKILQATFFFQCHTPFVKSCSYSARYIHCQKKRTLISTFMGVDAVLGVDFLYKMRCSLTSHRIAL